MALSPPDFYAYSRATGTPYPEDPEERAALAPKVIEFRRNQLKRPEPEPDYGAAIGATAAGAGVLAGGVGLARLFGRRPPRTITKQLPIEQEAAVRQVVQQSAPVPSTRIRESIPDPFGAATVPRVVQKPAPVTRKEGSFAKQYIVDAESVTPTSLTAVQQENTPQITAQQRAAIESGEDQQTGRIKHRVQQNEDQDIGRLDAIEDNNLITEVTRNTTDGTPADQTSYSYTEPTSRFSRFSREADVIAQEAKLIPTELPQASKTVSPINQYKNVFELEEQLEIAGERYSREQEARYDRINRRTVPDLTGELEVSPRLASTLRKEGIEVVGRRTLPLGQFFGKPEVSAPLSLPRNRLTPNELLERTMASATYPRDISNLLLDPTVPRKEIKQYLGTVPQVRGGAVSINPTLEIGGGARASMGDGSIDMINAQAQERRGGLYEQSKYRYDPLTNTYLLNGKEMLAKGRQFTPNELLSRKEATGQYDELIDTTDFKALGQKEKLEVDGYTYDSNTGNYTEMYVDDNDIDSTDLRDNMLGTDYGGTEGVGNLLIDTETFRERTNTGTTRIPGQIELARGLVPQSERQERASDVVLPIRRNTEGIQTPGVNILDIDPKTVPFSELLRLQDDAYRETGRLQTIDPSVGTNKLLGGYEVPVSNISNVINTQPASSYRSAVGTDIAGDSKGNKYLVGSKRQVTAERPLMATVLPYSVPSYVMKPRVSFDTETRKSGKPKVVPISLDRSEMQNVAKDAQYDYLNNPAAKAAFLNSTDPEKLKQGIVEGKTLSEIGDAYDYNNFIISKLDDYITTKKGYNIPFLKLIENERYGSKYYPQEAHAFIAPLLNTTKETPLYGKQLALDSNGDPVILKYDRYNRPVYKTLDTEDVPIPENYETRGFGGVDPMTVDSDDLEGLADLDLEGNIAFYSPRIEGSPQQIGIKVNGQTIPVDTTSRSKPSNVGFNMVNLRSLMETPSTGEGVRRVATRNPVTGNISGSTLVPTLNIGSFARTQNPYTGVAAAAAGPASRASQGNYQYQSRNLMPKMAPTSQVPLAGTGIRSLNPEQSNELNQFALPAVRFPGAGIRRLSPEQINELNQFALTANLTPGGYVREGALRLGRGDEPILSGVGSLSEGETIQTYGMTGRNLAQFGNDLMRQAALDKLIVTPQGRRGTPPGPTSVRNTLRRNAKGDFVF
jgi:hypothetical protein